LIEACDAPLLVTLFAPRKMIDWVCIKSPTWRHDLYYFLVPVLTLEDTLCECATTKLHYFYSCMYLIVRLQNGMQPIHFATMSGHTDITETLIDDYGVDVHSKDAVSTCTTYIYIYIYIQVHLKKFKFSTRVGTKVDT